MAIDGVIRMFAFVGRFGRWSLIAGLVAGVTLPELALVLKAWLPQMIFLLLLVSAFRIGPRAMLGEGSDVVISGVRVLIYQLAAPLLALVVLFTLDLADTAVGIAVVLTLAAPSISGAPNFAIMMGCDPSRAMRMLILGTALFPLTVIPVLLALPAVGALSEVVNSAIKLFAVIAVAVAGGFILRRNTPLTDDRAQALDGVAALLLGVLVIGLMSAMGPALKDEPLRFFGWLAFALGLNFGLQVLAYRTDPVRDVGVAVVAGNRNIALFLVALPPSLIDDLLLFIGCYQIPMYLTPLVMRRFMRSTA